MQVEKDQLVAAQQAGGATLLKTFVKLSGPGWLQSAITLGGGSLAGALFLGVIGGYNMLWVQLLAMIMGVVMLCAISYVTLSTGRSPFEAIRNDVNPVLAWGWLIASLLANLVWVLPQYSLAYAALSQNLMPEAFADAGDGTKYTVSFIILIIVGGITLCYGSDNIGIKIYEFVLKLIVAAIVLCFMGVVLKLSSSAEDFNLLQVLSGFIPDLSVLNKPMATYQAYIDEIPDTAAQAFWTQEIVESQRSRMVAAAATAVGINMTFLLPYSMLSKKWTREFRGLAIFDLSTGMVIPFVIAVSCVVIASAYMFHGKPYEGLIEEKAGQVMVIETSAGKGAFDKLVAKRNNADEALAVKPLAKEEKQLAAMLVPRNTKNFANALSALSGDASFSNFVFGLGVLAMALSTISILMLISGFVFCEMLGAPHGGFIQKLGILAGATGVLWPALWSGNSKAYLAIVTSTFGYVLFPIACLTFFLMMNSKRLLGDDLPRGAKRVAWNLLMGISLLITGLAAGHTATTKKLPNGFEIGTYGLIGFILLVIAGHFYMKAKHKKEDA